MSDEFFGKAVSQQQVSGAGTGGVESRAPQAGVSVLGQAAAGLGSLFESGLAVKQGFDMEEIDSEAAKAADISRHGMMDLEFLSKESGVPVSVLTSERPSDRHKLIMTAQRQKLKKKYPGYEAHINSAFENARQVSAIINADMQFGAQVAADKAARDRRGKYIDSLAQNNPALAPQIYAGNASAIAAAEAQQSLVVDRMLAESKTFQQSRANVVANAPRMLGSFSDEVFGIKTAEQAVALMPQIEAMEASLQSQLQFLTGDNRKMMTDMIQPYKDLLENQRKYLNAVGKMPDEELRLLETGIKTKLALMQNNMSPAALAAYNNPEMVNNLIGMGVLKSVDLKSIYGSMNEAFNMADGVPLMSSEDVEESIKSGNIVTEVIENPANNPAGFAPKTTARMFRPNTPVPTKFPESPEGEAALVSSLRGLGSIANIDAMVDGLAQNGMLERVMASPNPEVADLYKDAVQRAESALMSRMGDVELELTDDGYKVSGFPDMTLAEARQITSTRIRRDTETPRQAGARQMIQYSGQINRLNRLRGIGEALKPSDHLSRKKESAGKPQSVGSVGPVNYKNLFDSLPIPQQMADWLTSMAEEQGGEGDGKK